MIRSLDGGDQGWRIVLEKVKGSVVCKCKANRVWDACVLANSDEDRGVRFFADVGYVFEDVDGVSECGEVSAI